MLCSRYRIILGSFKNLIGFHIEDKFRTPLAPFFLECRALLSQIKIQKPVIYTRNVIQNKTNINIQEINL